MRPEQLLEDLTEPQRQAVMHRDGPLLVLAGAGSGKTRVITRRVAYLAATGVRPQQILAITFTNKAADEMRQRIAALGAAGGATVGTFHWFCARLLRRCADRAGLQPNFSIFDQTDRLRAIRQAVSQCELASENWPPHRIEAIISNAKNAMLDPERFAEQRQEAEGRTIARIYRQYQTILAQNNALDFDDLLMCVARLLGQHQQLRDELEDRYLYVLVDEYQDTNNAQYVIAHRLTLRRQNICVTGDPDQSIYGWRGANLGNILEFERHYPQARVIRLEQNYRSTKRILRVAGRLISANVQRKQKQLWTHNDEGPKVQVWACDDAVDEARRVAAAIAEMHADGRPLSDFAIFYRINAMTRTLEEALRERALAYQIARGVEFYSRKEIKDALAYLRVMVNPADEVSLLRIINTPPRGIGKTTVERLRAHAGQTGRGLLEIIRCSGQIATLRTASGRLKSFLELLEGLMGLTSGRSVHEVLQQVLERTGLERAVIDREGPDSDAAANLAELVTAAADYDAQHADGSGSLQDWLAQVSLVSDVDKLEAGRGAVNLMSLHAAKGLEFPVVFILGLEEGLLPHSRASDQDEALEEERRLCFVGMTRAKQILRLSYARYRSLRGATIRTVRSRFLDELSCDDVDSLDEAGEDAGPPESRYAFWRPGQSVRHPEYGLGRLVRVDVLAGRAVVHFDGRGQKSFVLRHSPIELVQSDSDQDG